MAPTTLNRVVLLMSSLVLAVGVVDGIVSREWDFLAVFAVALALQLLLLARLSGRRPAVPIRRDLVAWLRTQAAMGGESMEAVADRAVSAHRAGFAGPARSGGAGGAPSGTAANDTAANDTATNGTETDDTATRGRSP